MTEITTKDLIFTTEKKEMVYKPKWETEILLKGTYKDYEFAIVSYGTHPCAYIAMPENHSMYNVDYMDYEYFNVHGGLTYSGKSPHLNKFTIGWDYAHLDDYMGYDETPFFSYDTKYSTDMILGDVVSALRQLEGLK